MSWLDTIAAKDQDPLKVLIRKGDFIDEERHGRLIPYKIYYPTAHNLKKIPIILWSHGFGGNADGAAYLSRYIASHGYILVHMTHIGSDSRLWEGKDGHPWDILRKLQIKRQTTLSRFEDVPLTLDRLKTWAQKYPEQGEYMDFSNIGMSGHSFGALTTQVMAGMLFPNEEHRLTSYEDNRFKAGILYSPVPIDNLGPDKTTEVTEPAKAYGGIDIPLLHMTGTSDDSPIDGAPYQERFAVYDLTKNVAKYMLIKKGGDHMVYNGTRGKLEANPLKDRHEEIIKVISLAFWDAQLKNDGAARKWLTGDGILNYIGKDAEFKFEL